jgi:hypothetical protein
MTFHIIFSLYFQIGIYYFSLYIIILVSTHFVTQNTITNTNKCGIIVHIFYIIYIFFFYLEIKNK